MAISKTTKAKQTNITLQTVFTELQKIVGKLTKTEFAEILCTSKQNIGRRMGYDGFILTNEVIIILNYLSENSLFDNDLYVKLSKAINPVKKKGINEVKAPDDDNFVELNVRGEVGLSCGYGTVVYNDSVTGKCKVPRRTLREYGASASSTEVVYAQGDSMSPEIKSGDALLVDTSQTEIIDGVIYAFNYDGQPMCKRLQKIGKDIKAISSNPLFDSFIIDFTCQFNIVGRVVGFMRPVL